MLRTPLSRHRNVFLLGCLLLVASGRKVATGRAGAARAGADGKGHAGVPRAVGRGDGDPLRGHFAGGMVFPLLVGALAGTFGIARSYWFCAAAAAVLLAAALAARASPGRAERG